jgi:branched-chain amino acid transport system substrate-binding protein
MKKLLTCFTFVVCFSLSLITQSNANEVKIGVLYPLTGPVAQVGIDAVAAVKTALDIINNSHDLGIPLSKEEGLSGLNGAKISIVVGDHGGNQDTGIAETERMV